MPTKGLVVDLLAGTTSLSNCLADEILSLQNNIQTAGKPKTKLKVQTTVLRGGEIPAQQKMTRGCE